MKLKSSKVDIQSAIIDGYIEESYWIIKNKFYVTFRYDFDQDYDTVVDYLFDLNGTTDKKAIKSEFKKLSLPLTNKIREASEKFFKNINEKIYSDKFKDEMKKIYSGELIDELIIKALPRIINKIKSKPLNIMDEIVLSQLLSYIKEIWLLSVTVLASDKDNKAKAMSNLLNRLFPTSEKEEEVKAEKLKEWEKFFK